MKKASMNAPRKATRTPSASFPIVGVGASAGGLAAFEAFFSAMPAAPGMAFVLVQHLDPAHKSILAELIRRYPRMPVFEVEDGMAVRPDCVYIIPPGHDMAYLNGALLLLEPQSARGQRMPIDFFFRSLAANLHERAIAVVLSGTGSDGTSGMRAVKAEGGMAMVQSPGSAEFDGMPRSALATGLMDYDLPPAKMAEQLRAYVVHALGRSSRPDAIAAPQAESALKKIFILMRAATGHDFSLYIGLALILGAGLLALRSRTPAPEKTDGPPSASGESGFVGHRGWVVRLPKDYVGMSEFKDKGKSHLIVHFCKRGTDPTNFLNENLFGQMEIVRLEVTPSPFPPNPTGVANLTSAANRKISSRGEKFVLRDFSVGTLPGVLVNIQSPYPRVEAYLLGKNELYFFYGGQEDDIWRDIVLSLRDARSEN